VRPPVLDVQGLEITYRTQEGPVFAVRGVSFSVAPRERIGIVGESGCGKSATALGVMRLLPKGTAAITADRLDLSGTPLLQIPPEHMRRVRGRQVAMVFQDPLSSLNPVITIGEQLRETILAHQKVSRAEADGRAVALLESVGVRRAREGLRAYPHEFSGGMRQRVMIAMALALEPSLLIADEPTTALDVTVQAQVLDVITRLVEERQTSLILITHDLGVVAGIADRVLVMYAGRVVEEASTRELYQRPAHPYTVGLLGAMPSRHLDSGTPLAAIPGSPPDARSISVGCPFAPRCSRRLTICEEVTPALDGVDGTDPDVTGAHRVACHNPVPPAS
jgi:oligopeptide/dipeptide ABC transporter ATP-binding protein